MLAIFAITAPIFALIALGFFAVRLGLFQPADMRLLGRFVITLPLPALLIVTIARRNPAEMLQGSYILASFCATLAGFLFVLCTALLRHRPLRESAVLALGVTVSNKAFMGLPIVVQVVGPAAPVALALTLVAEDILVMPIALLLADLGCGREGRGMKTLAVDILRSLARNPVLLGIGAGLCIAWLRLPLPDFLFRALSMLGEAAAPTALFAIGGTLGASLARLRRGGTAKGKRSAWPEMCGITAVKLVLHPLLVGLFISLSTLSPDMRAAAILFASMPVFTLYPILSMKYGMEVFCSAIVVLATLLSFLTISATIWCVRFFVLGMP